REDRVEDPPRLVAAGDPAFHDHELVVAPEAGMAEELAVAAETPARASPRTAEDHDVGAPRVDVLAVAELVGEMAVSTFAGGCRASQRSLSPSMSIAASRDQ